MAKYIIGTNKPKIKHIKEKTNWIPVSQALVEDGDYTPVDDQGWS